MYHRVDDCPTSTALASNYVSPSRFADQLDAFLEWGYTPIEFDDWIAHRTRGAVLPPRPLIVTFDDGYTCFDLNAWPMLRARGIRPCVFLVAGEIGGTNSWEVEGQRTPLLSANRIRALREEGVRFGAHGVRHVPLARVPTSDARLELTRSRSMLEDVVGEPMRVFAYPYSNQNASVRRLAREAGYHLAVRGKGRLNWTGTDPHGLRRILMNDRMTVRRLRRTLTRLRWLRVG